MKQLRDKVEAIQIKAMEEMEQLFQVEFNEVFKQLQTLYPKRDINIIFGNGTMVVTGFDNLRTYLNLCDSYGNLNDYDGIPKRTLALFEDNHPIIKLLRLIEECYYPSSSSGYTMALEDLNKFSFK